MGFKLGDFFDQFGEGMKAMSEYFNRSQEADSSIGLPIEVLEFLEKARKNFDAWGAELIELNEQIKNTSDLQERIKLEEKKDELNKRILATEKQINVLDKKYSEERTKYINKEISNMTRTKKGYTDLFQTSQDFSNQLEELFKQYEAGIVDVNDLADAVRNLKLQENIGQAFGFVMADASNQFKAIGSLAGTQIGSMLGKVLPPQLQIIAKVIESFFMAAWEQVSALNKVMIDTLRKTGGVVNSAMLGFDAMGNSLKGMASLETQAINANISAQEFGNSISNLFKGGFGQIAGLKTNLQDSAAEIANFGIQAARASKLYGADISGSVRNLMMNFNQGIGESTELVKENMDYARAAGLNVQEVIKNLEAATALAGKFYFKTTEELTKLTFMATKLGMSVDSLASNVLKMNGLTDLFKKQQEMAALELGHVANNLAKVYALRAQGEKGEAERVMMTSLAKDLSSRGFIREGQVTQQGIATMEAAGVDQEAIKGLSRLARQAEETGISMEKILSPEMLTESEKKKLDMEERKNRTLEEQFRMTFGKLKQTFIDPIAKFIGSIISGIMNMLEPIISITTMIIDTVNSVFEPFRQLFFGVWEVISNFFVSIFEPVERLWKKIQDGIQPVIDGLTEAFGWLTEALGWVFDGISTVFGWLIDAVAWLVENVFKALGWAINEFFIKPLKLIWNVLKAVGEFIWEGFLLPIVEGFEAIIDFLKPLWDFFADLFEPIAWIWDLMDRVWGSSREEAGGLTAATIDEMLGKIIHADVQGNVSDQMQNLGTGKSHVESYKERTVDKQVKETETLVNKAMVPTTNVTVNTKVDPIFGNKNSIKQPS